MPIPAKPLNEPRLTAKDRVYNTLLEWITEGTMRPGEKIMDTEIAAYFSVSRTPVREALQLLADQKLIEIIPNRESIVSGIHPDEVRDNYELIGRLNCLAMAKDEDRINEPFLQELTDINNRMKEAAAAGREKEVRSLDKQFHQKFFELADNYFLTKFFETLYTHCLRIENLYFTEPEDSASSIRQHEEIISYLYKGDMKKAQKTMMRNWTDTIQHLPF